MIPIMLSNAQPDEDSNTVYKSINRDNKWKESNHGMQVSPTSKTSVFMSSTLTAGV